MIAKASKEITFGYNLKCYWEVMKNYKLPMVIIVIAIILSAATDLIGNYLLKVIVDNGNNFVSGTLLKEAFISILLTVALVYGVTEVFSWFLSWLKMKLMNKVEASAIYDLKRKYFDHILGLSHNFYTTHKTGSLIARMSRGGSALERMTDVFFFNGAPIIFQFLMAILSMLYFDFLTALIATLTAITFIAFSMYFQRVQEPSSLIANKNEDIEKGNIADIFTNIDSIKYFGKESFIKKRFHNLANKTRAAFLKNWNYYNITNAVQRAILGTGSFLIIYFCVIKLLNGQMSIGTLVFINSVYLQLLGPLYGLVNGIRGFYRSMADFQDLFEYGKIQPEIKDKEGAKGLEIKHGEIEFKDVTFNYGNRKIFRDFNLKVPKEKKIALVGHSGSGKTTLVKLLYRLYDINGGAILIDGKDIRDIKHESLRSEMSVVPQECILFDATVYDNILFSRPDATRKEVMDAIKFAQLDRIIQKFPKKELTIVGERGVKLSGGEKQRVSIARAILANKKILVLDEATSALDSQTEHDIQEDLKELMEGRTSIVIAHRLSTIMNADKIIVMKDGKIVQAGTHNELISQKGEYQHLWDLQKGGYIK